MEVSAVLAIITDVNSKTPFYPRLKYLYCFNFLTFFHTKDSSEPIEAKKVVGNHVAFKAPLSDCGTFIQTQKVSVSILLFQPLQRGE